MDDNNIMNPEDLNKSNKKAELDDNNEHFDIIEKDDSRIVERIDMNNIFCDSLMNNKIIFLGLIPLFLGYYLQDTVFTRTIAKVTNDVPGFMSDINLTKVFIFMLPYIIALVLFYVSNIITSRAITKIELETTYKLTDKLIESIKTSKKQINVNDLILHIKKVGDTKSIYTILATYIVPTIIIGLGLLYGFIQIDGTYSLLVILIFIVMICVTMKLEFSSIDHAYNTEDSANYVYEEIHEILTNMDTIITSDTHDKEMKNIEKAKDETFELACISNLSTNTTTYSLQAISIVSILGINYLAYRLYASNKIDGTVLTSTVLLSLLFMDYYNYTIQGIKNLINSMARYTETRNYFNDFFIIKQQDDAIKNQITLKVPFGNINIKNLSVNYKNNVLFNNLNLQVKGHGVTGLLGPIGSGKTTILKVLAGITDYKGTILIDGQNLADCSYESIMSNIAYISQHPKLFNKSIYYNINYGSNFTEREITNKLKNFELIPFINSFPKGLDTIVGKEGSGVSGGQRQFIALIRSLIQNKLILLLDEPSSSLDTRTKSVFIQLIKNLKDKTIIISTHDEQIMSLFNNVIDMAKSKSAQSEQPNNYSERSDSESDVNPEQKYVSVYDPEFNGFTYI